MFPINPEFIQEVHDWSEQQGFWKKETPENKTLMAMSKLALVHSEVSEATEEVRCGKLNSFECSYELADVIFRVINFASHYGIDINAALMEKHTINLGRQVLQERGKLL